MFRKEPPEERRTVSASGPGAVSVGGDVNAAVSTYVYTAENTPLDVAIQNFEEIHEIVSTDLFSGRRWLFDLLREYKGSVDRGYFLIEAEAGLGKTSFAARLTRDDDVIAHFSRLGRGTSKRVALRNLSAQLLVRYNLFDELPKRHPQEQADRSTVPGWTQEEAGFAKVLSLAAKAALAEKDGNKHVTLVVDGLDEAEDSDGAIPFGLPSWLPAGVFVVATYRIGTRVSPSDAPSQVHRLSPNDPRNLADIRERIEKYCTADDVKEMMRDQNVTEDGLVRALTKHCQGNWAVLTPALINLRTGAVDLATLNEATEKLTQFYVQNFAEWRATRHWHALDLPLLGTLAAAYEPLSAATLSDLTGIDRGVVSQACAERYRAFLSGQRKDEDRCYELHHRSLRDFISGAAPAWSLSEVDMVLREELQDSFGAAHHAIADFYLRLFGGSDTLSALSEDLDLALVHRRYGLRNLVRHLNAAGRRDDAWRLLTARSVIDGKSVSPWLAAHERVSTAASYVEEILAAQQASADELDAGEDIGADSKALRFEVLSALELGGTSGVQRSELVAPRVRNGVTSVRSAYDSATGAANPGLRCLEIISLLAYCKESEVQKYIGAARRTLSQIVQPYDRVKATAALLPHLPASQWAEPADEALEMAWSIRDPQDQASALLQMSPFVPAQKEALLTRALTLIRGQQDASARSDGLAEAVQYVPEADRRSLCYEALSSTDGSQRAVIAAGLLDVCPDDLRAELWTMANSERETVSGYAGVSALISLARHSPDSGWRAALTKRAFKVARAMPNLEAKALAMADLRELRDV